MKLNDFLFDLPQDLIAQYPAQRRDMSRLFVIDREKNEFYHKQFKDIVDYIPDGDILVLNNTKVNPWRFYGEKSDSKISVEILLLKKTDEDKFIAIGNPMRRLKKGVVVDISPELSFIIEGREGDFINVKAVNKTNDPIFDVLERNGHMPLPPYIKREDKDLDRERYQTVYASMPGAIAAPTAGLHFTEEILEKLKNKGVNIFYITLHVGIGTFRPIKTENIEDHKMHEEEFLIEKEVADKINELKRSGSKLWAVGTTTVRCLESAAIEEGKIDYGNKTTSLYIYPGYKFKMVDHIITNFHLPGSSLVVMISAFVERERLLKAYNEAIEKKYRFFSYGDAMLIV